MTYLQLRIRKTPMFMPHRIVGQHAALFFMVGLFILVVSHVYAQSPSTIGGRTMQITATSGTYPFAQNAVYRFLPSGVDSAYAIVPISGEVDASTGTHTYTKTGANTASLEVVDSGIARVTINCTFSTTNSGTYTATSTSFPGAYQIGTFMLYVGASPTTIAGSTITINITSGKVPFAGWGSYRFLPTASGSYNVVALSPNIQNSSGTYSYSQNSAYTGVISFADVIFGQGNTYQLSFDTPTTGTVFFRMSGTTGYQTGLFSMTSPDILPYIEAQPSSQTVIAGGSATFSVSASGTLPLSYQWRKNGTNIDNAYLSAYTITSVQPSDQAAYDVIVRNSAGSATSSAANLIVVIPPGIEVHPVNVTAITGTSVMFSVKANGSTPLLYQWLKNKIDIEGAKLSSYTIGNVQPYDAANYSVRVSNAAGSITSKPATLQIILIATECPAIETPILNRATGFSATLRGQTQTVYRVQWSTDLVNWSDLTNFVTTGILTDIQDHDAKNANFRYYRAVSP